jgi:hypothetical protein
MKVFLNRDPELIQKATSQWLSGINEEALVFVMDIAKKSCLTLIF